MISIIPNCGTLRFCEYTETETEECVDSILIRLMWTCCCRCQEEDESTSPPILQKILEILYATEVSLSS